MFKFSLVSVVTHYLPMGRVWPVGRERLCRTAINVTDVAWHTWTVCRWRQKDVLYNTKLLPFWVII